MVRNPNAKAGASLAAWRRGRRRRVGAVVALVGLGLGALGWADRRGGFGAAGADRGAVAGRWSVVASVAAGHGAGPVVRLAGGQAIGLLGVVDVPGGAQAAAKAVRGWIGGQRVRVRFARGGTRDAAGRRTAYVETAAGVRLNERLLVRGLARPDGAAIHADAGRYRLLGQQARDDRARAAAGSETRGAGLDSSVRSP